MVVESEAGCLNELRFSFTMTTNFFSDSSKNITVPDALIYFVHIGKQNCISKSSGESDCIFLIRRKVNTMTVFTTIEFFIPMFEDIFFIFSLNDENHCTSVDTGRNYSINSSTARLWSNGFE